MTEESLSSNIWNQRDLGVDLSAAKAPGLVSDADVEYLCDHTYPFIQLVDGNAVFSEGQELNFITTSSGWVIHDYGEAISVSFLHTLEQQNKDSKSGSNTINQATVAEDIARLIAEKGWISVEIIAGTPMMKCFIWMESKKANFDLVGYTPSASDEKRYAHLAKRAQDMGLTWDRPPIKKAEPNSVSTAE
jgi:hypothetical protein